MLIPFSLPFALYAVHFVSRSCGRALCLIPSSAGMFLFGFPPPPLRTNHYCVCIRLSCLLYSVRLISPLANHSLPRPQFLPFFHHCKVYRRVLVSMRIACVRASLCSPCGPPLPHGQDVYHLHSLRHFHPIVLRPHLLFYCLTNHRVSLTDRHVRAAFQWFPVCWERLAILASAFPNQTAISKCKH